MYRSFKKWFPVCRGWCEFGVAALMSVGAIAACVRLHLAIDEMMPLVLIVVACSAATYLAGPRAGVLTVAASALFTAYFLFNPWGSIFIGSPADKVHWLLLVGSSLFLVWLISRLRSVEEALRRANEGLAAEVARQTYELACRVRDVEISNRDLERFAYVVSHDLQSPLNNVANFIGLSQRALAAQQYDNIGRYLEFAGASADQGSRLVKDLLEYSRVTASRLLVSEVDVAMAADIAINNLKSEIDATGTVVHINSMPRLRADETQLVRLFQNLIGNAIKYRRQDTPLEIGITARRDGEGWHFSVADNGIGIPADKHEEVFQAFRRLHTDDEIQGSGIGLSVCRHVVEHHGGRIWVDSSVGVGSTFSFFLPDAI